MHKDLVVNLIIGQGLLPKCRSFKVTNQLEPRSYHLHLKHLSENTDCKDWVLGRCYCEV